MKSATILYYTSNREKPEIEHGKRIKEDTHGTK